MMLCSLIHLREAVGGVDVSLEHSVCDVLAADDALTVRVVLFLVCFCLFDLLELFLHILSYDLSRHDFDLILI